MIAHPAFGSGSYAIVGGIELNGLGLLRALGRANVPTIALDTDMDRPTAATRFGTKVRVKALAGPVFIDEAFGIAQPLREPSGAVSDARGKRRDHICRAREIGWRLPLFDAEP